MTKEEIRQKVLSEYEKGKICFATFDGIKTADLEEYAKGELSGILYDLNRDEATILAFSDQSPRWINDLAMVKLLKHYRKQLNGNTPKQTDVATDADVERKKEEQYNTMQKRVCDECFNRKPNCPWRNRHMETKCEYLSDIMYGYELAQQTI